MPWFRHRGHRVDSDPSTLSLTYEDGIPAKSEERPCRACGRCAETWSDPDPCLGILAETEAACCGHGFVGDAYALRRGKVLQGERAITEFAELGCSTAVPVAAFGPDLSAQLITRSTAWIADSGASLRHLAEETRRSIDAFSSLLGK